MGKPAPGIPLNSTDTDDRECAPGEEGNIALKIRSPNEAESFFAIFDGYISEKCCVSRPEHQFIVNGKTETWYLTGDKGKKDEMGYFWFVGRADDVINSAGYRIGKSYAKSLCV
jgi:medium-chain acyl-CoA synthetase